MSAYRPYPKYKPSGVEWLGDVPEHWQFGCLTRITSRIIVGIAEAATHAYAVEGIPILRSTNIRAGRIRGEILFVDPIFAGDRGSKQIKGGDLVTVRTGNAGVTAVVPGDLDGCQCFTMLITSLNKGSIVEYYCYWMNSTAAQCYFSLEGWGTAQVNISVPILKALPIPLPPLPEQFQIAAFLDRECGKLDALQAKQERLIELLKEKRQALISHAVTRGLDPTAKLKTSGIEWLGEVPEHWDIQPLSYVCRFQSGKAHEPFIDDDGEFVCVNSRFVSTEGESRKFCSRNLSPAKPGDILMVMSDLPNGRALAKAYFVSENEKLAVNQRVCILTAYSSDPKFLYYYLDRNQGFLRHDDGVSQTHLSNSDFTKLKLPIPPIQEQRAIVAHLDEKCGKIDQLKAKAERGIELLKERRSALISAAVTGKIDVREN